MTTTANRSLVTPAERRLANSIDLETSVISEKSVAEGTRLIGLMQAKAVAAFRRGGDPTEPVRQHLKKLQPTLTAMMLTAHLRARLSEQDRIAAQVKRSGLKFATVYDDALEYLKRQLQLNDDQLAQLTAKYGAEAVRLLTNVERAAEKAIVEVIAEQTARGVPTSKAIRELIGVFDRQGLTVKNRYAIEGVFRTAQQKSYAAGRYNALNAPGVQDALWGYKYVTAGDGRVRPNHAAMEGVTLPKDHPFWIQNLPPAGWGCRCVAIPIFAPREIVKPVPVEVDGVTILPQADAGFDVDWRALFADLIG